MYRGIGKPAIAELPDPEEGKEKKYIYTITPEHGGDKPVTKGKPLSTSDSEPVQKALDDLQAFKLHERQKQITNPSTLEPHLLENPELYQQFLNDYDEIIDRLQFPAEIKQNLLLLNREVQKVITEGKSISRMVVATMLYRALSNLRYPERTAVDSKGEPIRYATDIENTQMIDRHAQELLEKGMQRRAARALIQRLRPENQKDTQGAEPLTQAEMESLPELERMFLQQFFDLDGSEGASTEAYKREINKRLVEVFKGEKTPELASHVFVDRKYKHARVEMKLSKIFGTESVLTPLLNELGISDLPFSVFVPLSEEDLQILSRESKFTVGQKIMEALVMSQDVTMFAHGYGGNNNVAGDVVDALTGFEEDDRTVTKDHVTGDFSISPKRVMVAFGTKGASGTVLNEQIAGHMENGAAQTYLGMRALALLSKTDVTGFFHSMGAQEGAILLNSFLSSNADNFKAHLIGMVLSNSPAHLALLGLLKNVPGSLTEVNVSLPELVNKLLRSPKATEATASLLGVVGRAGLQRHVFKQFGLKGSAADQHAIELHNIWFSIACRLGLRNAFQATPLLKLIMRFNPEQLATVSMSGNDRVLTFTEEQIGGTKQIVGSKFVRLHGDHYLDRAEIKNLKTP